MYSLVYDFCGSLRYPFPSGMSVKNASNKIECGGLVLVKQADVNIDNDVSQIFSFTGF
jgi:hypothetical protein